MIKGLARDAFVCPDRFANELDTIFARHWIPVAKVDDLQESGAAKFVTVEIGEHSVIVSQSGSYIRAFHNVCRHRGTRLLTEPCGELKNDCVTCPYHAWSYAADDGRLLGAPNMAEVNDFDKSEFGLAPVACHTWAGLVFLNLKADPNNSPTEFCSFMQPLLDRMQNWNLDELKIAATIEYDVAANWKLIFQNYSECYHCPTVHPDLNTQTPYKSATNDLLEGPILGGPMQLADGFATVSKDGQAIAAPFHGLSNEQARSIYYYTVFPGMFVSAHPDYVMIHRLRPSTIDRTTVYCHFLVAPDTADAALRRASSMWDTVNQQDWQVCELTQLGVQSPAFQPGPYSNLESMLAAFDRHYRVVMNLSN